MPRTLLQTAFLLASVLGACSSSGSTTEQDKPMPSSPPAIEWQGPTVHASVATVTAAPQIGLQITVPTGGYEFSIEKVEAQGKDVVVEAKLVHPGDDEIVTQALVTLRQQATAPLPTGRVLVRVAEWKRGVQYLVAPASQLAAVVSY